MHSADNHRDNICYGDTFCLCIKFAEAEPKTHLTQIPKLVEQTILHSRTEIPLPQPIELHENWKGNGWEYKRKYGKTQSEMVEFLHNGCGLYEDEIRRFLRCKSSSIRGRLSELRKKQGVTLLV